MKFLHMKMSLHNILKLWYMNISYHPLATSFLYIFSLPLVFPSPPSPPPFLFFPILLLLTLKLVSSSIILVAGSTDLKQSQKVKKFNNSSPSHSSLLTPHFHTHKLTYLHAYMRGFYWGNFYDLIYNYTHFKTKIRECSSTLYVRLAHAAPPTQYKTFAAFSTNWLSEGSSSTYTCKEQWISRPG